MSHKSKPIRVDEGKGQIPLQQKQMLRISGFLVLEAWFWAWTLLLPGFEYSDEKAKEQRHLRSFLPEDPLQDGARPFSR